MSEVDIWLEDESSDILKKIEKLEKESKERNKENTILFALGFGLGAILGLISWFIWGI